MSVSGFGVCWSCHKCGKTLYGPGGICEECKAKSEGKVCHVCGDGDPHHVVGQACVRCFWRRKNEERDRVMGEEAAKAAKEEAVKINLKRDIQASLDKIEALKAEVERLKGDKQVLEAAVMQLDAQRSFLKNEKRDAEKEAEMQRHERARLQDKLDKAVWSKGCAEIAAEDWRKKFLDAKAQRDELATQIDRMGEGGEHEGESAEYWHDLCARGEMTIEALREKVRGLEHDLSHAEDVIEGLKGDVRQAEKAYNSLREELDAISVADGDWREAARIARKNVSYWHALWVEVKQERDEALAKLAEMENRTTAVYDGCSNLTEENEELRSEVRRLTEVSLGLAAIVAGKGLGFSGV